MGTDIHSLGQVKIHDRWTGDIARVAGDMRNYDTFAILADIRNGFGVAGIKTGEGWPVISEPRGLPKDLQLLGENSIECPTCYNAKEGFFLGDHSHSWNTLTELKKMAEVLDTKWVYTKDIVVAREAYIKWKETNVEPEMWSAWVSGLDVKVVLDKIFDPADKTITHVKTKMTKPWRKVAWSYCKIIAALGDLKEQYGIQSDDDVRLVFGFDS